jgi:hypothetical protein
MRMQSALLLVAAIALSGMDARAQPDQATLVPFKSQDELLQFLRKSQEQGLTELSAGVDEVVLTGSRVEPSITSTQHAQVDEGGIVKRHGDHLVVLRRGRIFTIDVSGPRLTPIASVNAYAPGENPSGGWYDEMLVSDDTIVIIGYSYVHTATEIGVFDINGNGYVRHRATYHFRSFDYYSSRNYASRLIDGRLVLYAPLALTARTDNPLDLLPAIRRWRPGSDSGEFRSIVTPGSIFRQPGSQQPPRDAVLHTVTVCDLARLELSCSSSGVIGQWGRVFYVSPKAMYVWTGSDSAGPQSSDTLFRLPLDGSRPGALAVSGGPVDQFSFEETRDRMLNVLVRSESGGDAMWNAEDSAGAVALLRLPLRAFTDGTRAAPLSAYRVLPAPADGPPFHNRFVGDFLLYGTGEPGPEDHDREPRLFLVNSRSGRVSTLALAHGVERLEAMGDDALVVGEHENGGENEVDLHLSGVRLRGAGAPALVQHYVLKHAAQGEERSQGYFYRPDARDRAEGVLGLPVRSEADPRYADLFEQSAGVVFVRNRASRFQGLGMLRANDASALDDSCQASCVDWYGNSRPVFIEDRVFALLGYELVEGEVRGDTIREVRRVSFAPRAPAVSQR